MSEESIEKDTAAGSTAADGNTASAEGTPAGAAGGLTARQAVDALMESFLADGEARNMAMTPATRVVVRTDDVYQTEAEKGSAGYPQRAVDIFSSYRNAGALESPSGIGMTGRSKRGENYCQVYLGMDPASGTIARATFRAHGSLGTIASASLAASLCEGLTPQEALGQVTVERLREEFGGSLPRGGAMGPLVAAEAVRAAVGDLYYRAGATLKELEEKAGCDDFSQGCLMCENCSLRKSRVELRLKELQGHKQA